MTGRKQFEVHEISADRDICELRYTCEVAFSRVTQINGLKDVIPFELLSLFDDMGSRHGKHRATSAETRKVECTCRGVGPGSLNLVYIV